MKYMILSKRYSFAVLSAALGVSGFSENVDRVGFLHKKYEASVFSYEVKRLEEKYHHRGIDPSGPVIFHQNTTYQLERLQKKVDGLIHEVFDLVAELEDDKAFGAAQLEAAVPNASISRCAVILLLADSIFPRESEKIRDLVSEELARRDIEADIELARVRVWIVRDDHELAFRRSTFGDAFGVVFPSEDGP